MTDKDFPVDPTEAYRAVEAYQRTKDPRHLFRHLEVSGKGAYGLVYKSVDLRTGKLVALKIVDFDEAGDEFNDIQREVSLLASLDSPFITKYYGSYVSENFLWIVMEWLGGGTSYDLTKVGQLSEECVSVILRNVVLGLQYLHQHGYLHRDIKASNILLSTKGDVKLADFGVAAELALNASGRETLVGTPSNMAPEIFVRHLYDFKVDIWATGITGIELAEGKPPHYGKDALQTMILTNSMEPPKLGEQYSENFRNFVESCLKKDPKERPTASELLKHPFLQTSATNAVLVPLIEKYKQWAGVSQQRLEVRNNLLDRKLSLLKRSPSLVNNKKDPASPEKVKTASEIVADKAFLMFLTSNGLESLYDMLVAHDVDKDTFLMLRNEDFNDMHISIGLKRRALDVISRYNVKVPMKRRKKQQGNKMAVEDKTESVAIPASNTSTMTSSNNNSAETKSVSDGSMTSSESNELAKEKSRLKKEKELEKEKEKEGDDEPKRERRNSGTKFAKKSSEPLSILTTSLEGESELSPAATAATATAATATAATATAAATDGSRENAKGNRTSRVAPLTHRDRSVSGPQLTMTQAKAGQKEDAALNAKRATTTTNATGAVAYQKHRRSASGSGPTTDTPLVAQEGEKRDADKKDKMRRSRKSSSSLNTPMVVGISPKDSSFDLLAEIEESLKGINQDYAAKAEKPKTKAKEPSSTSEDRDREKDKERDKSKRTSKSSETMEKPREKHRRKSSSTSQVAVEVEKDPAAHAEVMPAVSEETGSGEKKREKERSKDLTPAISPQVEVASPVSPVFATDDTDRLRNKGPDSPTKKKPAVVSSSPRDKGGKEKEHEAEEYAALQEEPESSSRIRKGSSTSSKSSNKSPTKRRAFSWKSKRSASMSAIGDSSGSRDGSSASGDASATATSPSEERGSKSRRSFLGVLRTSSDRERLVISQPMEMGTQSPSLQRVDEGRSTSPSKGRSLSSGKSKAPVATEPSLARAASTEANVESAVHNSINEEKASQMRLEKEIKRRLLELSLDDD